jgi:CO/xanthine dehydrogenase Mo-binding subunit
VGTGSFNPETTPTNEETGEGVPFAVYHYATQVAEVEVDTETGEVEVLSVVAAHDVGKAINPQSVEGQIDGGVSMGIGYALMEEVVLERGLILTPTFAEYLIPTALDVTARITPVIIEVGDPTGPFGAKGTGEPPACPTGAAIANAVYDAVGVRIREFPLTAQRVFEALVEAGLQG